MKFILTMTLILLLSSCNQQNRKTNKNLDHLVMLMTGSFSSQNQSINDNDYYDIRLEMVQIWKGNTNGRWLYVEQAVSTNLDKPYRQRIYHVTKTEKGLFSSAVYELPNAKNYVGAYKNIQVLDELKPTDLNARQGCSVFLEKLGSNKYAGMTDTNKCLSSLRGATYATSIVNIDDTKILSWDRGFDSNDEHVWGAEKGAYIFNRK